MRLNGGKEAGHAQTSGVRNGIFRGRFQQYRLFEGTAECFKLRHSLETSTLRYWSSNLLRSKLIILGCLLRKFLLLLESLLLKVLDFGLQRPTIVCAGVVTSIRLVSIELECLGVSLACATYLRCHLWSTPTSLAFDVQYLQISFDELEFFLYGPGTHISLMFNQ